MRRLHNFCAGPGRLPDEVLEEVREEIPVLSEAVGASILEISHRSAAYESVASRAKERILRIQGLHATDWDVLFLQGGASQQFFQVPMNLLGAGDRAGYLLSGVWAEKAWKEASRFGEAIVVGSSEGDGYSRVPEVTESCEGLRYVHYCSNNTIFGTRFERAPDVGDAPLVCDVSSEFLSRPMSWEGHSIVYAGAQKNVGPAGVTVVLVRRDTVVHGGIPTLLSYDTHRKGLYHTPPVFAVYVMEKVLAWLEREGGVVEMERRAEERASRVYGVLDRSVFWRPLAERGSRSRMNVTFRLETESLEGQFVEEGRRAGLMEMGGHRSAGGLRVSLYNACPLDSVEALVSFMDWFEGRFG
jgi:phosphoserine aminotransferase